jgi:predicted transcriptional regulator
MQKMLRRSRQRSKTEIISSILRSTHNRTGTRISQIMYETYIPYNQLKEYLTMMIQNKLILYVKEEKIFRITEYGIHALKLSDEMARLNTRSTNNEINGNYKYNVRVKLSGNYTDR